MTLRESLKKNYNEKSIEVSILRLVGCRYLPYPDRRGKK
jgi:hypothetical protein